MVKVASNNSEMTTDVVAVYQEHVQVISELKKAQWQLMIIVMAVLAGMITGEDHLKKVPGCWRQFLPYTPFLVWAFGMLALYKLNKGLRIRRQRIKDGRLKLSPRAIEVFGSPLTEDPAWSDDWQLLVAGVIVTFGAALAAHLVLR